MKKYEVAVMALALAFVGVARGQTLGKSQVHDRAIREYQRFVGQFPSADQTRRDDMKQYTEALQEYQELMGQFPSREQTRVDDDQYAQALMKFEQFAKTFEEASESFQKAERQYQKFLDSFPAR
jgi:tetratricopeptide (TPR) repeat protein